MDYAPPRHDAIFLRDEIDPFLWESVRGEQQSAWHGHVSFAHWIVQAAAPRVVVELGTHNGVSFGAFCNAVRQCRLPARVYAVDTWEGDRHAGRYGEHVFTSLKAFTDANYADFASMLRCYFDDALAQFPDGSVDLLHIDGLHTYEAVRHDFESWLPKMSERGVVLFHDTMVRRADFGVWQLWAELTARYPGFGFEHSSGLGVLAVGACPPEAVGELCAVTDGGVLAGTRRRFEAASRWARQAALERMGRQRAAAHSKAIKHGGNIALYQPACQSSAFGATATPEGAVNGIITGNFGFHTKPEDRPWWMVDLGAVLAFDAITIYNRLVFRERARSLEILISTDGEWWAHLFGNDGSSFGGADGQPLRVDRPGTRARFVRLQLRERHALHLDEVEIVSYEPQ